MATAPFDLLKRTSFGGIEFLVEHMQIRGGIRDHVHEYPHAPGGEPEKLGRKLYTISIDAVFATGVQQYPTAWPDDLNTLRFNFEQERTDDLVLPTIGTIKAYAFDWDHDITAKMRNGERVHIEFREHSSNVLLSDQPITNSYKSVAVLGTVLQKKATDAGLSLDIFAAILELVSEVQGFVDQTSLIVQLESTKVAQLANACRSLDALSPDLALVQFWQVAEALRDLGVAADNLNRDLLSRSLPIAIYVTPLTMTILDVSTAVYGDTSHAMDILMMNPIDDAFSIPSGVGLTVYAPAPAFAA